MKVHLRVNSAVAKKLWNMLRVTFLMMRKGVISKRKLIMEINLMMKKGKLLRKALGNLMSHHHHSRHAATRGSFGIQEEYEFSCSNSPNPVFFHVPRRRKHHYFFPCIKSTASIDEEDHAQEQQAIVLLPKTPEEYMFNFQLDDASGFAPGDRPSPLRSPFSVRVSNYSSEDENSDRGNGEVDDQAEEFIKRFYDQLRVQSHRQLLQYQDMLSRGTG